MNRFELRMIAGGEIETLFWDGGRVIAAFHDKTWWEAYDNLNARLTAQAGPRPVPPKPEDYTTKVVKYLKREDKPEELGE